MSPKRIFYVYAHYRKSDGRLFYIGKGKGERHTIKSGRNKYWKRIEKKHGRVVRKLRDNMPEPCALSLERALIAQHKESLCNITDGGEGASGAKRTDKWRSEMSLRMSGEGNPMFGNSTPLSDEHKEKIALANRKPKPIGFGEAVSKRMKGRKLTEEQKQKRRVAMRGRHKKDQNPMHGRKGPLCPRYDKTVYRIRHPDFGLLIGRQSKLSAIIGPAIYKLVNGKKPTYKGWALA